MLTISGALGRDGLFETDLERLRGIFMDLPALLGRMPSIESVEPFDAGVYRVILRRLGALNYYLWLAFDVKVEAHEDGIRVSNLPYDRQDPWIGNGVLLSEYSSNTRFQSRAEGILVSHGLEVNVHVPLPPFLKALPMSMVRAAGQALMNQQLSRVLVELEDSARVG